MNEKLIDEENENIIENNSIQIEEEEEKKELKNIEEENKVDNNLDEFPESNKNLEKLITNKNRKINPKILFYYKLFISVFLFVYSVILILRQDPPDHFLSRTSITWILSLPSPMITGTP